MGILQKMKDIVGKIGKKEEIKEVDPKEELLSTINQNKESGDRVCLKLEELRGKINLLDKKSILSPEQIEVVDRLLQSVQSKLQSPVDVLQDVKELDSAAMELIQMLSGCMENTTEETLIPALKNLCAGLRDGRASGSIRTIKQTSLRLRYTVIELQRDETQRHWETLQVSCSEVLTTMQQFIAQKQDTTTLNALLQDQNAQMTIASQEISMYKSLMARIENQIAQLDRVSDSISVTELTEMIGTLEKDMREQMMNKAEQIAAYHHQNLKSAEESKLNLEKIRNDLPGIPQESLDQSRRLIAEAQQKELEEAELAVEEEAQVTEELQEAAETEAENTQLSN